MKLLIKEAKKNLKNRSKYIVTVKTMIGDADGYEDQVIRIHDVEEAYEVFEWFANLFKLHCNAQIRYLEKTRCPFDISLGDGELGSLMPIKVSLSYFDQDGIEYNCQIVEEDGTVKFDSSIVNPVYA